MYPCRSAMFMVFVLLTYTVGSAADQWPPGVSDPSSLRDSTNTDCTQPAECDDDNLCTEDDCNPEGQCSNFPNYDVASSCCNPTTGALMVLECDENHCYDSVCFPMSCTCCDRIDGDPCAEPTPVPTAGGWGVGVMTLLLLAGGTLVIMRRRLPST